MSDEVFNENGLTEGQQRLIDFGKRNGDSENVSRIMTERWIKVNKMQYGEDYMEKVNERH